MENTAIVLIVFTNLFLVVILGVLAFLVYKLYQQKAGTMQEKGTITEAPFHPGALERLRELEKLKLKRPAHQCANHPDEPGETSCAICDRLFCQACVKPFKTMHLCKEHLGLVLRNEWVEVLTLKTSTADPEQGVRLYDAKKQLLTEENIPSYIETHYKINVDQDFIETYLVLYGMKEQDERLRSRLRTFMA